MSERKDIMPILTASEVADWVMRHPNLQNSYTQDPQLAQRDADFAVLQSREENYIRIINEWIKAYNEENIKVQELREGTFVCPSCGETKPLSVKTANGECRKCRGMHGNVF